MDTPLCAATRVNPWPERAVVYGLLLLVTLLVALPALRDSLSWRVPESAAGPLHAGFQIAHFGAVPYQDIFEPSAAGALLGYAWLGGKLGFDVAGVRAVELALLLALLLVSVAVLWRFGLRAVWAACLLFTLAWLRDAPLFTLAPEMPGLIAVAAGVGAAVSLPFLGVAWRVWLCGVAFGVAALCSLPLGLGLLAVIHYLAASDKSAGANGLVTAALAALGFALPLLALAGYLVHAGAQAGFADYLFGFLPQYARMTDDFVVLPAGLHLRYLLKEALALDERWVLLAAGGMGLAMCLGRGKDGEGSASLAGLLSLLALIFALSPALAGKFSPHEYLPMTYVLCLGGGLLFGDFGAASWQERWVPRVFTVLLCASLFAPHHGATPLQHPQGPAAQASMAAQVSGYLRDNLRPGDRVQALDRSGGVATGMVSAQAQSATPYTRLDLLGPRGDSAFAKRHRERLLALLVSSPPRFVVHDKTTKDVIELAGQFPALDVWIRQHYEPRLVNKQVAIYERKPAAESGVTP